MIRRIIFFASRFRKDEDGTSTIEFAIFFSLIFFIFFAGIEISYMHLRHSMLERSVDLAVRDIRLATGNVPSYTDVRTQICDHVAVGTADGACDDNLRLEMVEVDPRNFWTIEPNPDCVNADEAIRPVRTFEPGQDNALMLIRACLKYKPLFPTTGFAKELNIDSEGYAQLIVTSAFVQEPR